MGRAATPIQHWEKTVCMSSVLCLAWNGSVRSGERESDLDVGQLKMIHNGGIRRESSCAAAKCT